MSAQELLGSAPSVQIWLISDNCRIRSDNAQHSVWLQDQVGGSAGRPRARESLFTELCSVEVPTEFRGSFNILFGGEGAYFYELSGRYYSIRATYIVKF